MKIYKIAISGKGTKDNIINALEDLIKSLSDAEIEPELDNTQFEDSTLYTEISESYGDWKD